MRAGETDLFAAHDAGFDLAAKCFANQGEFFGFTLQLIGLRHPFFIGVKYAYVCGHPHCQGACWESANLGGLGAQPVDDLNE